MYERRERSSGALTGLERRERSSGALTGLPPVPPFTERRGGIDRPFLTVHASKEFVHV